MGICFKLQRDGNPLDILGVLDFLKYKIKKWGNTNIFSYRGILFNDDMILVIGSNTIEEAKRINLNEPALKCVDCYNRALRMNEFNFSSEFNDRCFGKL